MNNLKYIGIIPTRYASSRFPGKALADICGKTMIERVYCQATKALDKVVVATDDSRIFDAVIAFGGTAIMTSSDHHSGTERCYEAYCALCSDADVVINIQGDEPFIDPSQIAAIKDCFDSPDTHIATLVKKFDPSQGFDALFDSNTPKVVMDSDMNAVYFSRSIIPYVRNYPWNEWLEQGTFYTHIGMYAYRAETLAEITQLPPSSLEMAESLEQLRWIQNGYKIKVSITDRQTISIDTQADLEEAIKLCKKIECNQ